MKNHELCQEAPTSMPCLTVVDVRVGRLHRSLFILALSLFILVPAFSQTPVANNGALRVSGNRIVNANNQVASFSGPSMFWSNTTWGAERFYTSGTVNYFKNNWGAGIVRAAMGVDAPNGYLTDPANKTRLKAVVDAAIAAGLYVIIDWHTHNAEDYKPEAIAFFQEMAQTYGSYPNVLYEIYNEPDYRINTTTFTTWPEIKTYANDVIAAIRAIDPDNIIIVGTPFWSQDVDVAAASPITGYINIAYTLHFYAASHKQYLIDKAQVALNAGIALVVTEYGTVENTGDGPVDVASTDAWVAFMKANSISNCNWSAHNKLETASIFKYDVPTDPATWTDAHLTQSGLKVKDIVSSWAISSAPPAVSLTSPTSGATYVSPASVTINATASDSDGTVSSVSFYNGSTLLFTDNTSPYSYTWANVPNGAYTIVARATDNAGVTGSAAASVSVSSTANLALNRPVVVSSTQDNNSTFQGSYAVDGNDGTRWGSAYSDPQWIYVDLGSSAAINRVRITWDVAYAVDYTVQVSPDATTWTTIRTITGNYNTLVNDHTGLSATARYVRIHGTRRVTIYGYSIKELEIYGTGAGNSPPAVSITSPANGATFTAPASVTISANASDTDGSVSSVSFYNGTTLIATDNASPYSATWSNVAAGTYSLTARATDNGGAITTSAAVSITVNASGSSANIISNPGFESGTSSWVASGCTIAQDATQQQSGSYSLKATARSNQWAGPVQNIRAALASSGTGTYNYSAWVKTETGTADVKVTVMIKYGGNYYYYGSSLTVNSTGWTQISGSQSLVWTGALEDATFYIETLNGSTANLFADNCSMTKPGSGTYSISSSAGTGGTISPVGSVTVNSGGSQTFTITPNSGYQISDVVVNGASVGAVTTYTFSNVSANGTIAASFAQVPSNILSNPGFENGTTSWVASGCTIAQDGSQFQSGAYSLKASARSNQWAGPVQNIRAVLASNGTGTYNYSAWVKTETGTADVKVTVMIKHGGNYYYYGTVLTVNSTSWTQISGSQSLAWTGTLEDATFYVETLNSHVGNLFVDNCSMTKSSQSGRAKTPQLASDGVKEPASELMVECYPNPAVDNINIRLSGNWGENVRLELIGSTGRQILADRIQGDSYSMDVANLPTGLYMLNVQGQRNRTVQKIFKR